MASLQKKSMPHQTPQRGVSTFDDAINEYPHNSSTGNLLSMAGVNYTYGDGNADQSGDTDGHRQLHLRCEW
jgi:hypothetical protein